MILIDSNVFMYAAGADHPHKRPSVAWLERVARSEIDAVVDAEVLQEILHRYCSIQRWKEGRLVFDSIRRLVPVVVPIGVEVLDRARILLDRYDGLMARGAVFLRAIVTPVPGGDGMEQGRRDPGSPAEPTESVDDAPRLPDRIGDFRIVRRLGPVGPWILCLSCIMFEVHCRLGGLGGIPPCGSRFSIATTSEPGFTAC